MSDRFLWCRLWCYLRLYSPLFASVRALRCRSIRLKQNPSQPSGWEGLNWVQGLDLNQRPSGYEPDELPGCSTLQCGNGQPANRRRGCQRLFPIAACQVPRARVFSTLSRLLACCRPPGSDRPGRQIQPSNSIARRPFGRPVCRKIHRSTS